MCTLCTVKRAVLVVALLGRSPPCIGFRLGRPLPDGRRLRLDDSDQRLRHAIRSIQALTQDWATFFGSLVHGRELASLTVDLAPLDEVQQFCGPQALACYDPGSQTIEASPEDQLNAPAAKEIVTHEYGHHVANNSLNTPFDAEDYGTKRWASYDEHLQARRRRRALPRRRGRQLRGEPRRGVRRGLPRPEPDEAGRDLDRLGHRRSDALPERDRALDCSNRTSRPRGRDRPCPTCTARSATAPCGRSSPRRRSTDRSSPACTPRRSRACGFSSSPAGRLVASGSSVRYEICGQRALTLKVQRVSGHGTFTVDVSKP